MADREFQNEARKVWTSPELRRLRAGSAENGGTQNIPDGGDPQGNPRS
jgi:hypothetical protein